MKPHIKNTMEQSYPKQTMECLVYLESRCENLQDLLEDYRHLQPNGSITGLIKELQDLREFLYELSKRIADLETGHSQESPIYDDLNENSF